MNIRPLCWVSLLCVLPLLPTACSDDSNNEAGTTETTGDGDGDTDGECLARDGASSSFSVDMGDDIEVDWTLLCTLDSQARVGDSWELSLSGCTSQDPDPTPAELVLTVGTTPDWEPFVPPGLVGLRYVEYFNGGWFTLRSESGEMLWLAGLQNLISLQGIDLDPLDVEPVPLGCSTEVDDLQFPCALAERQGLRVGYDGTESVVADGNSGFVGQLVSYAVFVSKAVEYSEIDCSDFPNRSFSALFMLVPEG